MMPRQKPKAGSVSNNAKGLGSYWHCDPVLPYEQGLRFFICEKRGGGGGGVFVEEKQWIG